MQDVKKIQVVASGAADPLPWFEAYLRHRAHLASDKSDFHCDPACQRPGCKNQDLQVPVSIVDVIAAARHRGTSVSAIYQDHYSLGLLSNEREDWIRMVTVKLRKPCPYLENDLCSIYAVRPLPCILFPEYLVPAGRFEADAGEDHFKDYLCFQRPIALSVDRARIVANLRSMWERESLITCFYLFEQAVCRLDFSNLIPELLQAAPDLRNAASAGEPEPRRIIPNQVLEDFFLQHIGKCRPFARVMEKVQYLNTREGQAAFLHLLQDERLIRRLQQDGGDRALVFRFVRGKLRTQRRSLTPPEAKFY